MSWRASALSSLTSSEVASRAVSPASRFLPVHSVRQVLTAYNLPFEYGRYRKIRPLLFRGLSGRILEAGIGTGRNFPFYPPESEVVGIDLSPAMLARAERRRSMAATKVELRQMDVTRLSFPDRSFDAAVATFLFCTLPDELQVAGMRELGRVVKPGGLIRCLEYTRPSGGLRRKATRLEFVSLPNVWPAPDLRDRGRQAEAASDESDRYPSHVGFLKDQLARVLPVPTSLTLSGLSLA